MNLESTGYCRLIPNRGTIYGPCPSYVKVMVSVPHPFHERVILPAQARPGWEESPFAFTNSRLLGFIQLSTTSYRTPSGEASVRLSTLNHPRLANVTLFDTLVNTISDILWARDFQVQGRVLDQVTLNGRTADRYQVTVTVGALDQARQALDQTITASTIGDIPLPAPISDGQTSGSLGPIPNLPATPDVDVQRLTVLVLSFKTRCLPFLNNRCLNTHTYVGLTNPDHEDAVLQEFPTMLEVQ